MINKLREETQDLHEEIEQYSLAKQILEHNIDLHTYKLLLWQNYIAYAATETQVEPFLNFSSKKHLQLKKDLFQLGMKPKIPSKIPLFECHNEAEAYGAAYVIEGSALGGMLIAKNLKKCDSLKDIETHHFFNGDKTNLDSWKSFKDQLASKNFDEGEQQEAIEKAKDTFRFFGEIMQLNNLEQEALEKN